MNNKLINPAVTKAIAEPLKMPGTSAPSMAFADPGKQNHHQRETNRAAETEQQRLHEIMLGLHVEQRDAEHGALVAIRGN